MSSPWEVTPTLPITFVLQDAGETKAMLPIMRALESKGVDYAIIAQGTARSFVENNPHKILSPLEIESLRPINPMLAAIAQQKLMQAQNALCCITGMVSDWQNQWAQYFKQLGRHVVGYYDALNVGDLSITRRFWNSLTQLITPTRDTASLLWRNGFNRIPVLPLGSPSLENGLNISAQAYPYSGSLRQQLTLNPKEPTILFLGQYGGSYETAFHSFCKSISGLKNKNILVSLHPASNGEVEQRILREYNLSSTVKILPKSLSTEQVLPLADLVLSHSSTASFLAALENKPVIFIGESSESYNPLLQKGLARRYSQPLEIFNAIESSLQTNSGKQLPVKSANIAQLIGLPLRATVNITSYLLQLVGYTPI